MPTARPSSTTRSSISVRGNICDRAGVDLPAERLVGAEQELLAGLAAGVEGARHLGAAERAVVEQAAVLAGEGHALGHALVDDVAPTPRRGGRRCASRARKSPPLIVS